MFKDKLLYFRQSRAYFGKFWPGRFNIMFLIPEAFLHRLEDKAVKKVLTTNLALLTYKRYVVDSGTRFKTVYQSHSFPNILNKQSKTRQYMMGIKTNHKK